MGNQSNGIGALRSTQTNDDVSDMLGKTTSSRANVACTLRLQAEIAELGDHRVSHACVVEASRRMGHARPNDLLQQIMRLVRQRTRRPLRRVRWLPAGAYRSGTTKHTSRKTDMCTANHQPGLLLAHYPTAIPSWRPRTVPATDHRCSSRRPELFRGKDPFYTDGVVIQGLCPFRSWRRIRPTWPQPRRLGRISTTCRATGKRTSSATWMPLSKVLVARWTPATLLARIGDEHLVLAVRAANASKALLRIATFDAIPSCPRGSVATPNPTA